MEYKPYTYLIGWSIHNLFYYGVEYKNSSKGIANPTNLWTTYFTSSRTIHHLRAKHGEPDVIQIRKIFNTRQQAIAWEKKVLKRMKVLHDPKWLNSNVAGAVVLSLATRQLIAEKNRGKVKHSAAERARRSAQTRERNLLRGSHSEETKKKISQANKGKIKHKNGRGGNLNPMWGRRKLPDGTWVKVPV